MRHNLLWLLLLILIHSAVFADCKRPQLQDFRFYSLSDAEAHFSDFQGLTGAAKNFYSERFLIAGGKVESCDLVTVGQDLSFKGSQVNGSIEAGSSVTLRSMGVQGSVTAPALRLKSSGIEGDLITKQKPQLEAVGYKRILIQATQMKSDHQALSDEARDLTNFQLVQKGKQVDCARLSEADFDSTPVVFISGEEISQCKCITLNGSSKARALINILGPEVQLKEVLIILRGGISPSQIMWNMPHTTKLWIEKTADPSYGLPGTVLAPYAETEFYEGLITGSLIVGSLVYDQNHHFGAATGQINPPGDNERPQEKAPSKPSDQKPSEQSAPAKKK